MTCWQLRPGVYVADVRGDLVFLDSTRNQYSCLTRSDAPPILALLSGDASDDAEVADLAADLEAAGLIVACDQSGRNGPATLEATANADFYDFASPQLSIGLLAGWRLAAAAIEMAIKLRLMKPAAWFRTGGRRSEISLTRACTLALQFDRLRPWVPGSGRCLPNSLLLLSFLRRHGVAATWVFGVQTFPFEAHCWVEYRGVVLNDTIEHVRWFTPIAVV